MYSEGMSSREAWRKFLLTLPDGAFFTLVRHYLGDLQTPFTKHRVIETLESRLASPDWIQARRSLMSSDDLDALAALRVLGAPTPDEAATFLGWEAEQFRAKAVNLQERFLALPFASGHHGELALSCWVEEDQGLWAAIDPSRLYPWVPAQPLAHRPIRLHEGTLMSLLVFLSQTPLERTAAGHWRKKPRALFLEAFFALGEGPQGPVADKLLGLAETLGLVTWQEGATIVVASYLEDFATLPAEGRRALLWLAPAYQTQQQVSEAARAFPDLVTLLSPHRALGLTTLIRLSAAVPALGSARTRENLFRSWIEWELLQPGPEPDTWLPAPALFGTPVSDRPWVQANYEVGLPTDYPAASTWRGLLACRLVRWDTPIRLELDREAFRRFLSRGGTAKEVQHDWETLAGSALPANLAFALRDWEAEHRSIRLWRGTVLAVEEDRRHLIEHSEMFAQAVLHTLAPGVWLVREDLLSEWSKDLQKRGLPGLPEISDTQADGDWGRPWTFAGWTLDAPRLSPPELPQVSVSPSENLDSDLLPRLLKSLEQRDFSDDEREEWRARILRRVVLTASQLDNPLGKGERLEARGIDLGGKIRLAEMAVMSGSDLLEIGYRDENGRSTERLVRPLRLDKQAGEVKLVAADLETGQPFQAWISRLTLVRKIRGSLLS